jgi:hypothetical protein
MSESYQLVNSVLALRSQAPGIVSTEVQNKINSLRGIIDSRALSSARNGGNWRNGGQRSSNLPPSQPQAPVESRWRGSSSTLNVIQKPSMTKSDSTGSFTQNPNQNPKSPNVYTGPPVNRYQSRFKVTAEPIEEKILNRIIRLKLNKFGPTTYEEILDFLYQILGNESVSTEDSGNIKAEEGQVPEFVRDFMLMVFRKAAAEEIYCPLYAKLLSEIGRKHSVIFEEMNNLYDNYMEIFQETTTDDAEKKVADKRYRQGYSQFIAELTALEILPLKLLAATFHTLFKLIDTHSRTKENNQLVDVYVDCLLRMARVVKDKQTKFFSDARSLLYRENKDYMNDLINVRDTTYPSLSSKSRFLLMDIQDYLRMN